MGDNSESPEAVDALKRRPRTEQGELLGNELAGQIGDGRRDVNGGFGSSYDEVQHNVAVREILERAGTTVNLEEQE